MTKEKMIGMLVSFTQENRVDYAEQIYSLFRKNIEELTNDFNDGAGQYVVWSEAIEPIRPTGYEWTKNDYDNLCKDFVVIIKPNGSQMVDDIDVDGGHRSVKIIRPKNI